jgi:hypothetical protein
VWQRRLRQIKAQWCLLWGEQDEKRHGIVKDTPCRRSYEKYAFHGGMEYPLVRDERRVLAEICTARSPKKSAARTPNRREFPRRNIICWHCGILMRFMDGPEPARHANQSMWWRDSVYSSKRDSCARCIAIINGLELPRAV